MFPVKQPALQTFPENQFLHPVLIRKLYSNLDYINFILNLVGTAELGYALPQQPSINIYPNIQPLPYMIGNATSEICPSRPSSSMIVRIPSCQQMGTEKESQKSMQKSSKGINLKASKTTIKRKTQKENCFLLERKKWIWHKYGRSELIEVKNIYKKKNRPYDAMCKMLTISRK
jgi:hypothetical protein